MSIITSTENITQSGAYVHDVAASIHPGKKIYVSESMIPSAGRGVFASDPIAKGEIIEVCPIIRIPKDDIAATEGVIPNYHFDFGNFYGFALGFGTLYNHNYEPNALYDKNEERNAVIFIARFAIAAGQEITTSYNNSNPSDKSTPPNAGIRPYLDSEG